ncbi:MAG: hypothetical protein IJI14_20785 [Anaerolineaceae bacterium]|nr:hypothetical protein [Anaerolineaceae bacterium]
MESLEKYQYGDKLTIAAEYRESVGIRSKRTPSWVEPNSYNHIFLGDDGVNYEWRTKNMVYGLKPGDRVALSGAVRYQYQETKDETTRTVIEIIRCKINKEEREEK